MVLPKKSVAKLKPYVNGKHSKLVFEQGPKILKLDSNESSLSPSPAVIGSLSEFIHRKALNWYPDIESTELIERLVYYTHCDKECIQTFNGSDNALETICRTFIEPGDEVVLCMPTYDHFRLYAESCDARLVPIYGSTPFEAKPDLLLKAVTDKTKIIYIVNPNNPTGVLYSEEEIVRVLEGALSSLVIVDEAYFEFCGQTIASLVQKYPNLMITRSFSKAFGLAGLRCGYILTNPENLYFINKIRIGKNINTLAQIAAAAALDDIEYMERYVSEVRIASEWFAGKLVQLGLKVKVTPANYCLVEVAQPKKVLAYLEENNIFVRDRSRLPQLEGFIRITIGHQLLMERLWKVFKAIPQEYFFGNQFSSVVVREA